MNDAEFQDLELIAPLTNTSTRKRACVIGITTSSAITDLSTHLTALANNQAVIYDFTADGGTVYFFLNNASAGTIDETATGSGATVAGEVLFNGVTKPMKIPSGYKYLVAKASVGCNLRIRVSSRGYSQNVGESTGDL